MARRGGELLITAPRVVPGTGEPAILEPGYVLVTDGLVAEAAGGVPPHRPDLALGSGYPCPVLSISRSTVFSG